MEIIHLLLNHWKSILTISGFILSSITFIRLFLLDKKYCKFVFNYSGTNNVVTGQNPGYQLTRIIFDIIPIKGDIFELEINNVSNGEILHKNKKKIGDNLFKIDVVKESELINFNFLISDKREILIKFSDEFDNQYTQILNIQPTLIDKHLIPFRVQISNRKWNFVNSINKYFK